MSRLSVDALLGLDYPALVGEVLARWGVIEPARWQAQGTARPALCRLHEGVWALELWHNDGLGTEPTAASYLRQYRQGALADEDIVPLYIADLAMAYCDLVEDGIISAGAPINVCVSTRHPLFAAACVAQQEGLPVYTVVGEDDGTLDKVLDGAPLPAQWQALAPYVGGKSFAKACPDVLAGVIEREDALDAMTDLLDDNGYLLPPAAAKAYALALVYREEAESRNPMVVAVPYHPYLASSALAEMLCERKMPDPDKAMRLLELETGWEVPAPLDDTQAARRLRNKLSNIGDIL